MRLLVVVFLATAFTTARAQSLTPQQRLAREVYSELISINTADSVGSVTRAVEAMAKRFRAAGFPESDVQILIPPGVAHGYKVLNTGPSMLIYATDRFYNPADEGRIPHNDAKINYDWELQHK